MTSPRPVTFVCGTPVGGALDSTIALAEAAASSGHAVRLIVAAIDPYRSRPRLTGAAVKLERKSATLGRLTWSIIDRLTREASTDQVGTVVVEKSSNVSATLAYGHKPDALVVMNSLRPLDLRRILRFNIRNNTPTAWYLREAASLSAVGELGPTVDVLLANSSPLAKLAEELCDRHCNFVPSVIDREGLREPSSRESILLVNPITSHGLEEALALAKLLPQHEFVFQESWPLDHATLLALHARISTLSNVEFRHRVARDLIFRDTRLLIAPHSPDTVGPSRPRTALEAQFLGIPMIAHDIPGLTSVAASPDLLVSPGSKATVWVQKIERLDADYQRYSRDATEFANREMPDEHTLWRSFAVACTPFLDMR